MSEKRKPIYLINDVPAEEAAYKVLTEQQAAAIKQVDPDARECSRAEYIAMMRLLEAEGKP